MSQIPDDPLVIAPTLEKLQKTFRTGKTKSLAFRKAQLQNLLRAFNENFDKIHAAMLDDLGYKNETLTKIYAITATTKVLEYTIANFESWAQDRHVDTNLLVGTASSKIVPEPYGVTLVIGSWNYSFYTAVGPAIEAIAAGNCVCIKPSELAPKCSNMIKEIFNKYMDTQCYQVIEGQIEIAKNICLHKWDLIIFTGSPIKGKLIAKAAAENLIPCILELGGKSPTIVDKDADIASAALRITNTKFANCGQTCVAPDYIYCHESQVDKLIDNFSRTLKTFYTEDSKNSNDYTRIITQFHAERLEKMLDQKDHNGKVVFGGKFDVKDRYIEPTIVLNPNLNSQMMQEEIFGPILPILTFSDIDSVIEQINNKPKPLALYYFGSNKDNIKKIEQNTSSGAFVQNDCMVQLLNPNLPFGGVGNSGYSSLHGLSGFNNCSHLKPVVYSDTNNKFPNTIKYPPYTADKVKWLNRFGGMGNVFPKQLMRKGLKYGTLIALLAIIAWYGKNLK